MAYQPDKINYLDTVKTLTDKTNNLMDSVASVETTLTKSVSDVDSRVTNTNTNLINHAANSTHITAAERTTWNATGTNLTNHTGDDVKHITAAERTAWNAKQAALGYTAENVANKGANGGYAGLDSNGKVPVGQLPSLDFNKTSVVATLAARDAITGMKTGDRAIVLDAGDGSREGFIWSGSAWLKDSDTDWANVSLDWANLVGKPASSSSAIDSAVTNSHTHSNKAILDASTASFTTAYKSQLDGASVGLSANALAKRNASGSLQTGTPNTGNDAANKTYVDTTAGVATGGAGARIQGTKTVASGAASHAEGYGATAGARAGHAEGVGTNATIASGLTTLLMPDLVNISDGVASSIRLVTTSQTDKSIADALLDGLRPSATLTWYDTNSNDFHTPVTITSATAAGDGSSITVQITPVTLTNFNFAETLDMDATAIWPSHAEGWNTTAGGMASHAEGVGTQATGYGSHAEGTGSQATGYSSHAEGSATIASLNSSHAEGQSTVASGDGSHSEGQYTTASGRGSHAEGYGTVASSDFAHAEGYNTKANNQYTHSEGYGTTASGYTSHAEGSNTTAASANSHAEGSYTLATTGTTFTINSFNNTNKTITLDSVAGLLAGNVLTIKLTSGNTIQVSITGIAGNVVTVSTTSTINSSWKYAVLSSISPYAIGSHAEGLNTLSSGSASHAEGAETVASGSYSHAEGQLSKATGLVSHAEGYMSAAYSYGGHAEGGGSWAAQGWSVSPTSASNSGNTVITFDQAHKFALNDNVYRTSQTYDGTTYSPGTTLLGFVTSVTTYTITLSNSVSTSTGDTLFRMVAATSTTNGGKFAHAEGLTTLAAGNYSHSEGMMTASAGDGAHAEGNATRATAFASHAEGSNTRASGSSSHAEGDSTVATGNGAHSEGNTTLASGSYSHAEGQSTTATAIASHAEGYRTYVNAGNAHVEGYLTGNYKMLAHVEGVLSASGTCASRVLNVSGNNLTLESGQGSLFTTTATGGIHIFYHNDGTPQVFTTTMSSKSGDVITLTSLPSTYTQLLFVVDIVASAANGAPYQGGNHVEGMYNLGRGDYSHVSGFGNTDGGYAGAGIWGQYGDANAAFALFLANGTNPTIRGLAFKVLQNGTVTADGAYSSTGADYAEMFEWEDGNPDNEDRVGYFVTLDGEKMRKATSKDTYIVGIISATPSIIGDAAGLRWGNKYITDEWGRTQYEDVVIPAILDEEGNELEPERTESKPKINPDWVSNEEYADRLSRPEWDAVGLMGKLLVRDDGTAVVNGFVKSNDEGIATKATEGYRVLKRVSDSIIQVLVK